MYKICAVAARVWQLMGILTMATGPAARRLLTELRELQSDTESRSLFLVEVDEEDILTWRVVLNGPPESPFAGGRFEVS